MLRSSSKTSWLATFFAIALVIRTADAMPLTPIERIAEKAANSVRLMGDSWADCGANNAIPPLLPMRSLLATAIGKLWFTQRTGDAIFPPPFTDRRPDHGTLHIALPIHSSPPGVRSPLCFNFSSGPALPLWCHNKHTGNGATELLVKNVTMSPFPVQVGKDFTLNIDTVNGEPRAARSHDDIVAVLAWMDAVPGTKKWLDLTTSAFLTKKPQTTNLQTTRSLPRAQSSRRSISSASLSTRRRTTCAASTHVP
jgi:hypothetical protein